MAENSTELLAAPEFRKMTKVQKLASMLVLLGPESASCIMEKLDDHELEAVSTEMSKTNLINEELQSQLVKEFSEVAVDASRSVLGGVDYTQRILEKSIGVFRATDIINRIFPNRTPVAAMQQIAEMEPRQILNLVKTEKPQTIALLVSYLPTERGSQVLMLMEDNARNEIIERLATLSPTPIEVVEKLVSVINDKLGGNDTKALKQTGGIKSAADLLNAMDGNLSKALLTALEEKNPELGQSIRQKMFTFEDLVNLEANDIQKILREVEMRDLALSLKTASDELKNTLLGCISKRAAETVKEEIGFLGSVKLRDVEAAQQRIIESVRRLESEGELEIGGSGKMNDEGAA